jgi:hypothetical protein
MKFDPIITGAVIGFGGGALGFIIAQFWLRPITKYQAVKDRIAGHLRSILDSNAEKAQAETDADLFEKNAEITRKLSVELLDAYNSELPPWYRMVLQKHKESPSDASAHLMTLANTRNPDHIRQRCRLIIQSLRLVKTKSKK